MVTFTGDVRALFSHHAHQHGLKLVPTDKLFQCDGCRQIGDELRYRCEQCDFDLHICCAVAQASIEHPMFDGCALSFFNRHPGCHLPGALFCDACGDPVLGFLYSNIDHSIDLHPCCAIMPEHMSCREDGGPRVMELHKATDHNCYVCGEVGYRGRFFSYRCQDDDGQSVYVHLACMMEDRYSSVDDDVQANSTTTGEVSNPVLVNASRTGELATMHNAPMAEEVAVPRNPAKRRTSELRRLWKIASRVAKVSYSVVNLDPVGVVTAVASRN